MCFVCVCVCVCVCLCANNGVVHWLPRLGIFYLCIDVNARCMELQILGGGGGGAYTNSVRQSAIEVDFGGKNPLPPQGVEPASVACWTHYSTNWATVPAQRKLNQLLNLENKKGGGGAYWEKKKPKNSGHKWRSKQDKNSKHQVNLQSKFPNLVFIIFFRHSCMCHLNVGLDSHNWNECKAPIRLSASRVLKI